MKEVARETIIGLFVFLFIFMTLITIMVCLPAPENVIGMATSTATSKVTVKNDVPVISAIPDQIWQRNNSITINLSSYCYDPEGFPLSYSNSVVNDINVTTNANTGIVIIVPPLDWGGIREVYFFVSDGPNKGVSNKVILTVEPLPPETEPEIIPDEPWIPTGCFYKWECDTWGECQPDNIQERICINKGNCPDNYRVPEKVRHCEYKGDEGDEGDEKETEDEVHPVPEKPAGEAENETIIQEGQKEDVNSGFKAHDFFLIGAILAAIGGALMLTSEIWLPFAGKWLFFAIAPRDRVFIAIDRQTARNLKQLAEIIKKMDKKTFDYHANTNNAKNRKDDFAEWIGKVAGDKRFASQLLKAKKTRAEYSRLINKRA